MKKLIIASLFLAGVSVAGNAQSAAIAAANHTVSPAIGKHPAKTTGKTNTIAAKSMTPPTPRKTAVTGKKSLSTKTPVKKNNTARKTVTSHKKHKAHKRLPKKRKEKKK